MFRHRKNIDSNEITIESEGDEKMKNRIELVNNRSLKYGIHRRNIHT